MILWKDWLVVVPARLAATRLPRKPLQLLGGKPLVVAVAENLRPLEGRGVKVVVATDSHEVLSVCQKHQITATLTDAAHQSGTDRVAEVAKQSQHPYILNVQGDDPFVAISDLETLLSAFSQTPDLGFGTLVHRNESTRDYVNPNVVKAVRDQHGYAVYFSRAPVPHTRNPDKDQVPFFWHHIGVYAFKRETLIQFAALPPSPLEMLESLEQLRAIEHRIPIYLAPAKHPSVGIDTPEDLEAANVRISRAP